MKTKLQIKSIYGNVLFEYECEDNTIKKTIEEVVKADADLSYADLSGVDLTNANLEGAHLKDAVLAHAILNYAELKGADLRYADLKGAYLMCANLADVKLGFANLLGARLMHTELRYADLGGTCLMYANLAYVNLTGAYLAHAVLVDACLRGTNLADVKLTGAILKEAILKDATYIPFVPLNLPEGEFIAYKKVRYNKVDYIVKLKVLADSKRSRAGGDKCRCDKALVMEIQDLEGNKLNMTEVVNTNYTHCTYKVGEIVYADGWDEDRFQECAHGIHFFLDRQNAVNY